MSSIEFHPARSRIKHPVSESFEAEHASKKAPPTSSEVEIKDSFTNAPAHGFDASAHGKAASETERLSKASAFSVSKAGDMAMASRASGRDQPLISTAGQVRGFASGALSAAGEAVTGLFSMASGAVSLSGVRGKQEQRKAAATLKEIGQTLSTKEGIKAFGAAIAEPYQSAWAEGEYGKAIGRGTFEAVSMVFGTKGLDKARKLNAVVGHTKSGKVSGDAASLRRVEAFRNNPESLLGASGRFTQLDPQQASYVQELLAKGTGDAASLKDANGVFKPENAAEALRVRELKAVQSHLDNGGQPMTSRAAQTPKRAPSFRDNPESLLGASGRFTQLDPQQASYVQELLAKGTGDAASLKDANGVFKPENAAEALRVRELKAVQSHLENSK